MPSHDMQKSVALPFDQVLERVTAALASEGFGVLTRVDVRATMKQKLGVDFVRYEILGACNPPLAHRALTLDPEIGLLLPCNVIVYEAGDGQTKVSIFDPMSIAASDTRAPLREVAQEARAKLERVLHQLA